MAETNSPTVNAGTSSSNNYEERDRINKKTPIFDGQNFEYWKDRLESFFLGYDADLWDIVIDGYSPPTDRSGNKIERKAMTDTQKKEFKNHHKARTILLNVISHTE